MSSTSTIEWTDATWNPVTGCTEISPGCDHCYARVFAERWRGLPGHPYEQGFDLRLWPERLELPLRWKKPRRIFVNSMSDLFHKDVPDAFIEAVFGVMGRAHWHIFQVLTKRAGRLERFFRARPEPLPPHIWVGVSVESDTYTWRVDRLRTVPAAVRFISAEPLIGPLSSLRLDGIHWVIAGGESGAGARPMHPAWVRDLRDQCVATGTAFFLKQWGKYGPGEFQRETGRWSFQTGKSFHEATHGPPEEQRWQGAPKGEYRARHIIRPWPDVACVDLGKGWSGRMLDGRTWDEMPVVEGVAC